MVKLALAHALVRLGRKAPPPVDDMETRHDDPAVPLSNDSSYVCGRGADGTSFVMRTAFRGARPAECWLGLMRPGRPQLLRQTSPGPAEPGFVQGPLRWICEVPGTRWRLLYEGTVPEIGGPERTVAIDLVFEGDHDLIEFSQITDAGQIARTIAAHPWSRDFFSRLRETHSIHYEQGGTLRGTLSVDGESIVADWQSVRDHSWGVRDWNRWDQHLWLFGRLQDGRTFNVSMIRYDALPILRAGFLVGDDARLPLTDCPEFSDFQRDTLTPDDFELEIRFAGRPHRLRVRSPEFFSFAMDGPAYRIDEGMAHFELDGVPGVGVAEFGWGPRHG